MATVEPGERAEAVIPLAYAPHERRVRRIRNLPIPVSITAIICGTCLCGAACVCIATHTGYIQDAETALCWMTGAAGFILALLGIFLAAPRNAT
jgi:threonine/homoserine/homoserine lactone efflux protein